MKFQPTFNKLLAVSAFAVALAVFAPYSKASANTYIVDRVSISIGGVEESYSRGSSGSVSATINVWFNDCTNKSIVLRGTSNITGNGYTSSKIPFGGDGTGNLNMVAYSGENQIPYTPGNYSFNVDVDIYSNMTYTIVAKSKYQDYAFNVYSFYNYQDAVNYMNSIYDSPGFANYNLSIQEAGGDPIATASVSQGFVVTASEPAPTVRVWSDAPNNTVQSGSSTIIHWESDNANQGCNSPQMGSGLGKDGFKSTGPLDKTTTFYVTCSGE